jgi:hypothetical protein
MIEVDKVYQKVLAIANKEQRGYITPQEFNLFADYAQNDIFRQYFYDLNQYRRIPGNNTHYADITNGIEEKISLFEMYDESAGILNQWGDVHLNVDFPDLYKITYVAVSYHDKTLKHAGGRGGWTRLDKLEASEQTYYSQSYLVRNAQDMTKSCAYYILSNTANGNHRMKIFPYPDQDHDAVRVNYIRKPKSPNWTYILNGENPLYNPTALDHQNFELHDCEEELLVIKILQLAGVNIKDYSLTQIAAQEEVKKTQQEKQ